MGLTGVQINGVTLPKSVNSANEVITEKDDESAPLTIGLTTEKELILDGEVVQVRDLAPVVKAYFTDNPDGSLMLKADRNLPYDDIAELLSELG